MSVQISGTTVIDNSRNVTNISNVSSVSLSTTNITTSTIDADTYQIQNLPTLP